MRSPNSACVQPLKARASRTRAPENSARVARAKFLLLGWLWSLGCHERRFEVYTVADDVSDRGKGGNGRVHWDKVEISRLLILVGLKHSDAQDGAIIVGLDCEQPEPTIAGCKFIFKK